VSALPNPFLRDAAERSASSRRLRERMEGIEPLVRCVLE